MRLNDADLRRLLGDAESTAFITGDYGPRHIRFLAAELLSKRRELRVARSMLVTAGLWPHYEIEVKARVKRRGRPDPS